MSASLTAGQWMRAARESVALREVLLRIYAGDRDRTARRLERLHALAKLYLDEFGDGPVVVSRAPGRVNLMGRHIDHQGGHCNMIAIPHDVYVMAGSRRDGRIELKNTNASFAGRDLDLDALTALAQSCDWRSFVDSAEVHAQVLASAGDWAQYVRAPILRARAAFPHKQTRGVSIAVAGDVPMAAGLSSSSALVVAVSEALLALTGVDLDPARFVEFCGEAEWFVGTRGGAGDHAAIKFGRPGAVVQVSFHPMQVTDIADWPEGYELAVCDSCEAARKTAGARAQFNSRVACYHIGREMVRHAVPELREAVAHLRDLAPSAIRWEPAEIVALLRRIPHTVCHAQAAHALGSAAATYLPSDPAEAPEYPVRSVVLFGLTECERARAFPGFLRNRDTETIGRLMRTSHDGDRVVRWSGSTSAPAAMSCADADLDAVAARLRQGLSFLDVPGAYACSTPAIDRMVDTALETEGVVGAQLAGAGLGGSMMALGTTGIADLLRARLDEVHYAPRGTSPAVFACRPAAGSCVLAW